MDFVAGETPAVLTGSLILTTAADAGSSAGAYAIVPAGQSAQNYAIRYVNGTLRVLLVPVLDAPPPAIPTLPQRDTRLVDRPVINAGGSSAECRPPPTPNERLCVGWPDCEVERPACETPTVESSR